RARRHVPQPRSVLRPHREVLANHQHRRRADQGEGRAATRLDHQRRLHRHDVRSAGAVRPAGGLCPFAPLGAQGELTMVIPLLLLLGIVSAQAATPAPPPAESAAEASFTYDPGGRRDPFVSLLRSGSDGRAIRPAGAVDGLAGLAIADIAVRGVVKARDGYLAIVQAPDRKTYLARPG